MEILLVQCLVFKSCTHGPLAPAADWISKLEFIMMCISSRA